MTSTVLALVAFTVVAWASGVPWQFAPVTGAATTGVMVFFFRVEEGRYKHKYEKQGDMI